jgi:hypothetical protein
VLIGGGGEKKTLRIVAQHADIWHSFADTETLERKLGILGEWCEKVDRPMSEIEISVGTRGARGDGLPDMDRQLELGVTLFTLGITAPELDMQGVRDLVAWRDSVTN